VTARATAAKRPSAKRPSLKRPSAKRPSAKRPVAKSATRAKSAKRTKSPKRPATTATTRRAARVAAKQRRSRLLVVVAVAFAAVVLATSFPFSELLGQRQQLATAQSQLNRLSSQNQSLAVEALRLGDPATVAAIARADYGFVQPGQKAFDILPTAGAPLTSAANSGHVPLEGPPVAPGSLQSQALLDAGAGGSGHAGSGTSHGTAGGSKGSQSAAPSQGSGLWGRVLHTLEFWR
jgi:cell division protein FtsB